MRAEEFVAHLQGVKRTKPGQWLAKCPAHTDKSPSLTIAEGDDGKVLLHCFAGCDPELVAIGAGVQFSDLFPDRMSHVEPKRRPPLDALAVILRNCSLELLIMTRELEALADKYPAKLPELHRLIAKIDECVRTLS